MLPVMGAEHGQDVLPRLLENSVATSPAKQIAKCLAKLIGCLRSCEGQPPAVVLVAEAVFHGNRVPLVLLGDPTVAAADCFVDGTDDRCFACSVPRRLIGNH